MTRAELLELLKKARKQLKKYHVPKDEQTVTLSIDTLENALSEQPQIVRCIKNRDESLNCEKVISTFEKIISVCKEDGCDFVDLTFEDAEQILALLKEQDKIIQNILREKTNELNDKVTTLRIELQNREMRRLLEQK